MDFSNILKFFKKSEPLTGKQEIAAYSDALAEENDKRNGVNNQASVAEKGNRTLNKLELGRLESGGDVLRTNLIEGEIVTYFDWRKSSLIMMGFVFIGLFAIAALYAYLLYFEKIKRSELNDMDLKIINLGKEINQQYESSKDILAMQDKLKLSSALLDNHIYWTNFFLFLEDNTLEGVYYKNFSGDTSGQYSLAASAKDFYSVSEQIKAFNSSKYVKSALVKAVKAGGEKTAGVSFNLELTIDPKLFNEYKSE